MRLCKATVSQRHEMIMRVLSEDDVCYVKLFVNVHLRGSSRKTKQHIKETRTHVGV